MNSNEDEMLNSIRILSKKKKKKKIRWAVKSTENS